MVKELSADEMEKQLIARTKEFEDHIRREQNELLGEIEDEIRELKDIEKKDDLGF